MRPTVFTTLVLSGMFLVSFAVLSGCASDPDATQAAEERAPAAGPTPGSMTVHVNGSVAAVATFGH
jgi:hypothetical protein